MNVFLVQIHTLNIIRLANQYYLNSSLKEKLKQQGGKRWLGFIELWECPIRNTKKSYTKNLLILPWGIEYVLKWVIHHWRNFLKSICNTTVWKWIKFLSYEYKERNKSYFSDTHEHKENVQYQKEFIKKIFYIRKESLPMDTYYRRWSKETGIRQGSTIVRKCSSWVWKKWNQVSWVSYYSYSPCIC